ncbi:hypothetical protein [Mucilaginibacter gotjawali]|uniref:Uncharacterized protein n=1 Tax=Mucilaginibacter gotjawali TaxID=1550579 RepID=A0A839SJI1_9SPHI|nr:hypothetical protein [Mucilaginibacter gotjawali]MBB3056709.1 hypothetical protein [Mucilaginibacter gotjawali]
MKKEMKPLSRAEMKKVTGGVLMKYIWHCRDTATSDYMIAGTCASSDPSAFCGEYSCLNSGVVCTGGEYCP